MNLKIKNMFGKYKGRKKPYVLNVIRKWRIKEVLKLSRADLIELLRNMHELSNAT